MCNRKFYEHKFERMTASEPIHFEKTKKTLIIFWQIMNALKRLIKCPRSEYSFPLLLIFTGSVITFYMIQESYFHSYIDIRYRKSAENTTELLNGEYVFYTRIKKKVDFEGEKLIHLDLKGAPPKISYLLSFIKFIKKLGATGILMEYEDMFPYHDELEEIKASNAYTISDIKAIIRIAKVNGLTIIPLIPTFSHFEFVLKLEQYKEFREVENIPQVLCPNQKKVYPVLQKMIDQVLEIHNTSKYLHIGCDEANYLGVCPKCQKYFKKNKFRRDDIYFIHVKRIAEYIMETHPGVTPIVWGDKFTNQNERIFLSHRMPDFVEIMLWNYRPEKSSFPQNNDMETYSKFFKNIWIANAFKGATGSNQIVTNAEYHLQNTKGWMLLFENWKTKINFKGIALTGWQRYNHFMALCELLPVGIPSLAINLQYINRREDYDYDEIKHSLDCNDFVPLNQQDLQDETLPSRLRCNFPGFNVYRIILSFYHALPHLKSSLARLETPQLSFYNILHKMFNPTSIHALNKESYKRHLIELIQLENETKVILNEIYDQHTVNEWIMTYSMPLRLRLEAAVNIINSLSSVKVWPRRPMLHDELQVRQFFNKICGKNETMGCTFFNLR